jgi:hypothetical protein
VIPSEMLFGGRATLVLMKRGSPRTSRGHQDAERTNLYRVPEGSAHEATTEFADAASNLGWVSLDGLGPRNVE